MYGGGETISSGFIEDNFSSSIRLVCSRLKLRCKGREMLEDAYAAANAMDVKFKNNEDYDIGDYVGTREYYTGIQIREEITKKIVKVNSNGISIECQIGE